MKSLYALFTAGLIFLQSACAPLSGSLYPPTATLPLPSPQPQPTATPVPTLLATKPAQAAPATPVPTLAASAFPSIYQLRMFTDQAGWAVSGYDGSLLHTQDGGTTWVRVTPPNTAQISGLFFQDAKQAWGSGMQATQPTADTGTLYRTSDGGQTWQAFPTPFRDATFQFMDVHTGVATADMGAAAGNLYFRLYLTLDGGQTWSLMHVKNPYGFNETLPPSMPEGTVHVTSGDSFEFQTPSILWFGGGGIAASQFADLYASRDAGQTWQHLQLPLPEQKAASGAPVIIDLPAFFTPQDGVFAARYEGQDSQTSDPFGSEYLATYITHDGGLNWTVNPNPLKGIGFSDQVDFVSMDDAYVACGDNLCATHDGGTTWQTISSNLHFQSGQDRLLSALDFVDVHTGWAVITQPDGSARLYKTTDGGMTWSEVQAHLN